MTEKHQRGTAGHGVSNSQRVVLSACDIHQAASSGPPDCHQIFESEHHQLPNNYTVTQ